MFPALICLITKSKMGNMLFDTGYSEMFYKATKRFPEKFYKIATPMDLPENELLLNQLKRRSINPDQINSIFISHFHADHISGLKDFSNAKFICSKTALLKNSGLKRLKAVSKGYLKELLPVDFEKRVDFIEDMKPVMLGKELEPFKSGYALDSDNRFIAIELPGHSFGQYGLLINSDKKALFMVSDSCWSEEAFTKNKLPMRIVGLIKSNYKMYLQTIKNLSKLYKGNRNIEIIPSHCSIAYNRWDLHHVK